MAMVTAADLVSALRAGQLLEGEQLAEAARLQGFVAEAKGLASDLIQRGWLTPFQANLLLQGRGQDLRLGAYLVLECLGEGGMGTVYKARQLSLGRIVAVKVIRKDRVVNPQVVKRFQREIRAAAQLNHPNIVRAFDADEIDGTLLLVMELVDNGMDLSQIVKRDGPLPIAVACDYIRQAALGLQHAHERGLVHRDIKPANLLLAGVRRQESGVRSQASGVSKSRSLTPNPCLLTPVVKILDMGLARLDHPDDEGKSSTSLTGEGTVMGTIDYIAPEQAMDSHHADIRADLYSLGCTFYYLLTGRVPFPGGDAVGKLIRQQTEEPEPFEFFRPQVAPALAAIVRKLMAKRREDRFQTPAELAVALEEVLKTGVEVKGQKSADRGQSKSVSGTVVDPKLARRWAEVVTPSSATEALVKPLVQFTAPQRKPQSWRWPVIGGAAALVLLLLLLWQPWRRGDEPTPDSGISKSKTRPPSAKELAEKAERKRQAEAEEALKPIAARMASLSAGASSAGEALRKELREFLIKHSATPAATKACDLLGQVLAKLPSPLDELDGTKIPEDAKAHWKLAGFDGKDVVAVLGEHRQRHWGPVWSVAYSPNGKLIASAGDDFYVRIWDSGTMQQAAALKLARDRIRNLAFTPDSRQLFIASHDATLWLLDVETRREPRGFKGHQHHSWSVAVSGDGRRIWSGGYDYSVRVWHVENGQELRTFQGHKGWVNAIATYGDGRYGLSGGADSTIRLWDIETGKKIRQFEGTKDDHPVTSLAMSSDGKRALSGHDSDSLVRVWNVETGKEIGRLKGHTSGVTSVRFAADERRAISGGRDGTARLWNVETGKEHARFECQQGEVGGVCLSPDGGRAVSGGADGTVRLWDVATGKEVQPLTRYAGPVYSVAFSPNCRKLLSGASDNVMRLWDLEAESDPRRFEGQSSGAFRGVAFSPDERQALSGNDDGTMRLWDVESGKETRSFKGNSAMVESVVFSPDGRRALSGSGDSSVRLWEVETGKELRRFEGHRGHVPSVALSPDGRRAVSAGGSPDATVRIWDLESGVNVVAGEGVLSHVESVAFSPDGRRIVSGGGSGGLYLWDVPTGSQRARLQGHNSIIWSVAFAPDGKTLASAGDGQIILWDVSGAKLREWQLPGRVNAIAFAAAGRHLATANGNGTVYIFRVADGPPRPLSTAEAKKQQQDAAERFGVPVEVENSIGMKLRLIPPGRFLMGSPESEPGRQVNEPQHVVGITNTFFLGIHEVTQGQYQKVMDQNPSENTKDNGGGPDHPVDMVFLKDALAFCKKLSELPEEKMAGRVYRLPSEAEWESACRAGTQTTYFFGNQPGQLENQGWYEKNSGNKSHPVGLLPANPWGLFDMHGNICEWVADNVVRGGSFLSMEGNTRSAVRSYPAGGRANEAGFRVVCDYRPPQITNSIGMKLARIPAGKFLMGSPENEPGRKPEEGPQHEVTIRKPFLIGVHEVTQEQYEKVTGTNPAEFNKNNGGAADHPVETVSWDDAVAFCKKLSESPAEKKAGRVYRLPTEAEWEYAYRAGTQARFPFGDDKTIEHAWLLENADGKTHAAGRLRPNPWGLFDMGGNVWEFAADYYDAAGYPAGPRTDPQGPATGQMRVLRGSGFDYPAAHARAAARGSHPQDKKDSAVGFRVVCEIPPSK